MGINVYIFINTNFGEIMNNTLWEETKLPQFESLKENIETEVLVIGGGICGVLCAHYLSKSHQVVLVEKGRLAGQRTNKTTATITALQDMNYKDIIHTFGYAKAKQYLEANLSAIDAYEELAKEFNFDFERVNSYKYFKNKNTQLKEELGAIQSLGYQASISDNYAICFKNQAQMNPMLLIQNLISSFTIYENTEILNIKNNIAYTKDYRISAKHIVVATGYPFIKLKGLYPLKLTQKKSYVMVVNCPEGKESFHSIGCDEGDLYFRTYKNQFVIGGGDQKTGKGYNGFVAIQAYIKKHLADHKIQYQWINQDCISLDGLPYIGNYGKEKNVYVATGFNLWGMTSSMLAAQILTAKIEGTQHLYEHLFRPNRRMLVFPLLKNIGTAVWNLCRINRRCTHLGCALHYIAAEDCYECPCHGTKYTREGKIIFNPANKNKK